jgi:hypothetical protein
MSNGTNWKRTRRERNRLNQRVYRASRFPEPGDKVRTMTGAAYVVAEDGSWRKRKE